MKTGHVLMRHSQTNHSLAAGIPHEPGYDMDLIKYKNSVCFRSSLLLLLTQLFVLICSISNSSVTFTWIVCTKWVWVSLVCVCVCTFIPGLPKKAILHNTCSRWDVTAPFSIDLNKIWSLYSPDSEMTTLTPACWRMIVKNFLSADKITWGALRCWGAQGNRQLGKHWSRHDTPSVQWYRKRRVYLKKKPFIKKTADPKFVATYLER